MLGALQMLYLCSAQECKENLSADVFKLSQHPEEQRGFPLAVLSLNITKIALDAFRDGLLNRFCNKEGSAIFVLNRFYLAVLHRVYKKWKSQCVTIHESCFVLKGKDVNSKYLRLHNITVLLFLPFLQFCCFLF